MLHHVTLFISIILFSSLLTAQDFTGLDEIYVTISVVDLIEEDIRDHQLKSDVELKLRMAGITVVDDHKDSKAELYFHINGFKTSDDNVFIISIIVTINEYVYYAWRLKDELHIANTYNFSNVYKISARGFNETIRNEIKYENN